jgi:hypothetical protein
VDIPVRRLTGEAAEDQFLEGKGISASKNASDILQTAEVAEHSDDRNFGVIFELVQVRSVQFGHGLEAHGNEWRVFGWNPPNLRNPACFLKPIEAQQIPWPFPRYPPYP